MQSTSLSQQSQIFSNKISISSPELATIISYPRLTDKEYVNRLKELHSLEIRYILPAGRLKIGKIPIAGKGCVSLVLKAEIKNKICALKIRRTDANRKTMEREMSLHQIANSAGVGPNIFRYSDNYILMEFIDGLSIIDWVKQRSITADQVRNVATAILQQCYNLDRAHIDHGELSCLDRHVIVSKSNTANIIDFESSSTQRRTSNVTAAAQSLFLNGPISKRINELVHFTKREKIIQELKIYKWNQTKTNFHNILSVVW
jgi:putative serine/threonine protein kinase